MDLLDFSSIIANVLTNLRDSFLLRPYSSMEETKIFKITKDMLDDHITETTILDSSETTYRDFLRTSWSRYASSSIPDFDKLGNSHLSAMVSYFMAKQRKVVAA